MAKGAKFNKEYKQEMVRLVTEAGKKPAEDIGVTATTKNMDKAVRHSW